MSAMGSQDPASNLVKNSAPSSEGSSVLAPAVQSAPPRSGSSLTIDQAWGMVLEHILGLTRAAGAAIALRERGSFVCKASAGEAPPVGTLANHEEGLVAECIRTAETVVSADTRRDPRVDPGVCQLLNLGSVVVIPLHTSGRVEGLISVSSPHAFAFDDAALEGLSAIAGAIELILFDAANQPAPPSIQPLPPNPPAEEPTSSTKPFASAFARAMADSIPETSPPPQNGDAAGVEASLTSAQLFAAAGTLRTDASGTPLEDVNDVNEQLPDLHFVPSDMPAAADRAEPVQDAHAVAKGEPIIAVVEPLASAIDSNVEVRLTRPEPAVGAIAVTTTVYAPPEVQGQPTPLRRAAFANGQVSAPPVRSTRTLIWLAAPVVVVVIGFVTFWLRREPAPRPQSPPVQAVETQPQPSPAATQPASVAPAPETITRPATNQPTPSPNVVRSAALTESTSSAPTTPQPVTPQPAVEQTVQKVVTLPPSAPASTKTPAEEALAPPPLSANGAPHSAAALNSLVVPAVSPVPVLSPRIDVSSVMLALRHDPKSVFDAAKLVTQHLPAYPEVARNANRQGSVVLQATVGSNGHVGQIRVVDGDSALSAAASAAVQSWLYEPAKLDGRPVESTVLVTMNFRLSQ